MSESIRENIEDNVNRAFGSIITGLAKEELISIKLADYIKLAYSVMVREPNWFKKQMNKITKIEQEIFLLVKHAGCEWYPEEKDEGPNGETIIDETE